MLPGAKAFCLSGAVARLPISMMSLGIVLALNHLYDNWTIAGTMSAAYVLAMSCVTPFYARAFDRFGQARVGRLALAVQIVAMLAFAFAALVRVPIPLLFALAIIMGLTQFSFGALVRTRWSYALRGVEDGEQLLNTAYAMEAAIDEIVFILGPILAAWLGPPPPRHRCQKEDQVRQKAVVDDGGGEEEKVQDYHQPRQQQSPAQLLLRRVHGVLVLPIPGGKAPFGGGIEVPARPQQHHGAADDAPGRTHRQHPVQGLPHRLRHASGPSHTGEKAQHAAQQPEQQNCQQVFGQRPAVVPPHVIAHGIHPPDR